MQRRSLFLGALAAGLPAATAWAQDDYPSRPVTIVVPGAPGGGGDFAARLLAEQLNQATGKTFVVDNRAGAAGNIATSYVARAQPDGYTLLLAYSGTHVTNPALYRNLSWDPVRNFTPVALLITSPQVIVVSPKVPARTLAELVAYARANPGKVNYASSGGGTLQQIGAELLAERTGIKMVHVPYKGAGAAMTDVLSGQVQLLITTPPAVVSHIRAGSLRALAMASRQRHPMLPEVPTTAEAGVKDIELDAWFGIYAPAGTPPAVVNRLAGDIQKVVEGPTFRKRSEESGTYATYMNPAQLDKFTHTELTYWTRTLGRLGIKAE